MGRFSQEAYESPQSLYNDAVEEAICFGWIDGIKRSADEDRYMHRFTPRKTDSKWSSTNWRRVEAMLEAGQMQVAGLASVEAAKKNGKWTAREDRSARPSLPAELRERLTRNRTARTNFDLLAPSYQRDYMRWVAAARKPATRERRADEAVELLRRGKKLGMK